MTIVRNPKFGEVSIDIGTKTITYTPYARFKGDDSFKYAICDHPKNLKEQKCSIGKVYIQVDEKCLACEHCARYIHTFNHHTQKVAKTLHALMTM